MFGLVSTQLTDCLYVESPYAQFVKSSYLVQRLGHFNKRVLSALLVAMRLGSDQKCVCVKPMVGSFNTSGQTTKRQLAKPQASLVPSQCPGRPRKKQPGELAWFSNCMHCNCFFPLP